MKDDDFARRLAQACDRHESVPAYGFGRQTWIKDKMHVSHEAVRKWARGETRPRPKKMKELAHLLGVDEAWLSLGVEPDFSPTEKKARGVTLEGVAQVFMGLLQAGGGGVAFAGAAGDSPADFFAIINGQHLAFRTVLGSKRDPETLLFRVAPDFAQCITVGAIRGSPFVIDFVILPRADHSVRRPPRRVCRTGS